MKRAVNLGFLLSAVLLPPALFAQTQNCLTVTCPTNKSVQCSTAWNFDTPTVENNPTPHCLAAGCLSYAITVVSTVSTGGLDCSPQSACRNSRRCCIEPIYW